MSLISMLRQRINIPLKETNPAVAYNMWAESYDNQPNNLMLALDEQVFTALLNHVSVYKKVVVDIGCGTGRHWAKITQRRPHAIYGYDVSQGMLAKLKDKYPWAQTYQMQGNLLPQLESNYVDFVMSTLTLAHIENISEAFREWHRLLKAGGDLIITDYHPAALAKGGKRTFAYNGKTVAIKNYVHALDTVFDIALQTGFEYVEKEERIVDEGVIQYYEDMNALHVYEKFKGVPIIYGMRLRKRNVT